MSDRSVQMAILVVLVAVLVTAIISLAKLPSAAATPIAAALVGMVSTAIGGLMILIGRPSNNTPPPGKFFPTENKDPNRP